MRASWKYGLFVSIGLLVDRAAAEELDWRPAAAPAATTEAPAAVLGKPVAVRPVQPSADGALRTVSFTTSDNTQEAPTFRLQMPDIPKPMPGANGKQKTGDKSSDLSAPREVRETIGPSFPPPPSPVPGPTPVPGDLGDFCVPSDCGGQGSCADGRCGWGGCCNPGDSHLWWFDAEYLLWWTKSGPAPVLVTTGPPSTFGVLGAAGTVPLFGGPIDYGTASGGRFTTGLWFCECQHFGIDASFFFLGTQSANFFAASDSTGSPVLSRPFTGAITGTPTVEQVAFPG
ncbi:MAG TPA: BBP7 family outer membrane beta-barrel protein, partial [Gemmataceae bacterium]|nr:BBP7 family outer membrane beta-barrel protein [Gemmataceae bacterium]